MMDTTRTRTPEDREWTIYSEEHPGSPGNYRWAVRFDSTDGFIGITQFQDDAGIARVLLSPAQLKALIAFMASAR